MGVSSPMARGMHDKARASGLRLRRGHSARARSIVTPEIAAVVVFIALIWLALYAALGREYRAAEREALQNNAALALAYADNAQRLVAGVDQLLLALRSSYAERPDGFDAASWSRLRTPEDRMQVHIGLIGPSGRLIGSTMPEAVLGMDLSDREHFRAQLDPKRNDLFISNPLTGRVTGKQTIQFSRKLLRTDGSFAGVGVVSVGCEELARFYEENDLNGFITMVGTEGIVRARGPRSEGAVGSNLRTDPVFAPIFDLSRPHGALSIISEGRSYILGFKRLEDYPLVVLVGTDHTAALASYVASRNRTLGIGLLVTLVTGLFGLFWVMQRRKSASFQRDLELTLGSVSQGIIMIDDRGRIRVVNQRAVELLGLPAEIVDRPAEQSAEHLGPTSDYITGQLRVLARGDKLIEAQARPTPQGGLVLTYSDVTERSKHEAQMLELAHHDRLTGLANRALLETRVQEVLRRAQVSGERFALVALDLDNFKMVNDEYGHEFGDMLLVEAAAQLTSIGSPRRYGRAHRR